MFRQSHILVAITCLFSTLAFSQGQYALVKLPATDIPAAAVAHVDSCFSKKKVKWFKFALHDQVFLEAHVKTKGKKRYEMEFNSKGVLLNGSLQVTFDDWSRKVKENINNNLHLILNDYTIVRAERSWSGKQPNVIAKLRDRDSKLKVDGSYKVLVKQQTKEKKARYEFFFDNRGEVHVFNELLKP